MTPHSSQPSQALHMQVAANRSALLLLSHHLARADLLQLQVLADELGYIGMARLEPDWQAAHEALAQALVQSSSGAHPG